MVLDMDWHTTCTRITGHHSDDRGRCFDSAPIKYLQFTVRPSFAPVRRWTAGPGTRGRPTSSPTQQTSWAASRRYSHTTSRLMGKKRRADANTNVSAVVRSARHQQHAPRRWRAVHGEELSRDGPRYASRPIAGCTCPKVDKHSKTYILFSYLKAMGVDPSTNVSIAYAINDKKVRTRTCPLEKRSPRRSSFCSIT